VLAPQHERDLSEELSRRRDEPDDDLVFACDDEGVEASS
jgi:hypothetical protein